MERLAAKQEGMMGGGAAPPMFWQGCGSAESWKGTRSASVGLMGFSEAQQIKQVPTLAEAG